MTESLCYSLETTTLLISYIPMQSAFGVKKKKDRLAQSSVWKDPSGRRSCEEKGPGRCLCHRGGHGDVDAHMPVCAQPSPGGTSVTRSVSAFGPGSQGSLETPEAARGRGVRYAPALRPHLSLCSQGDGEDAERLPYPTAQLRRKLGLGCS